MLRRSPFRSVLRPGLRDDDRGAALVEFALVAPVFVLTLIGLFDLAYNIYTSSLLEGSIQKAARDSTIEGASSSDDDIDERVEEVVKTIVPRATVLFERQAYDNFSDVRQPEDFTDSNGDGTCNDGEPFEDVNGNNRWDEDRGASGMGGGRDAVLYTVTVNYERQFPLHKFIPIPDQVTSVARTVLRNQPYETQQMTVSVENCA